MASLLSKSSNKQNEKGISSYCLSYSKDLVICMIENGLCKKSEIDAELKHYGKLFQEQMNG